MTTAEPSTDLQQIAFRPGDPETWDEPERNYEVISRICRELGVTRITEEIRLAGIDESDRQLKLFAEWQREQAVQKAEFAYRGRMSGIADALVSALVPRDDRLDRTQIVEAVLRALRPLDERLCRAESNGDIRRIGCP